MSESLARALGATPRPGGSDDPWTEAVVLSVDVEARRLEVSLGDDENPIDVPVLGFIDDYTDGVRVALMRRPTGYWAMGIMGGQRVIDVLPSRGNVAAISGSTVTVSTSIGNVEAGSIQSAVISVSDPVLLTWDENGRPWVVGRVGVSATAPATPSGLTLDREGSSVNASWNASPGATSYRVRWRYATSGAWSSRVVPGDSLRLSVGQGQTIYVQVQAINSGGTSSYTSTVSATHPTGSGGLETIRTSLSPSGVDTLIEATGVWFNQRVFFQGRNAFYGGNHTGWAGYGARIRDLSAVDITEARLGVRRLAREGGPSRATLQIRGTAAGTRPGGSPVPTGPVIQIPNVAVEAFAWVTLSASIREALRTGDIRGFVGVGSDISSWSSNTFMLDLTYRRPA